jgi:hypothetical protein
VCSSNLPWNSQVVPLRSTHLNVMICSSGLNTTRMLGLCCRFTRNITMQNALTLGFEIASVVEESR